MGSNPASKCASTKKIRPGKVKLRKLYGNDRKDIQISDRSGAFKRRIHAESKALEENAVIGSDIIGIFRLIGTHSARMIENEI